MRADNSAPLVAAAHARRDATIRRAREALRHLDDTGQPVTFAAVADAASVSRAWLYRDVTMRAEIERLRARARPYRPSLPVAQRASTESLQRRLEAASEEITVLREENCLLRGQLARDLGEQRSARAGNRS